MRAHVTLYEPGQLVLSHSRPCRRQAKGQSVVCKGDRLAQGGYLVLILDGSQPGDDPFGRKPLHIGHGVHPGPRSCKRDVVRFKRHTPGCSPSNEVRQHSGEIALDGNKLKVRTLLAHLLEVAEVGGDQRAISGDQQYSC